MPAPAVIPAPIAYINAAAVKKRIKSRTVQGGPICVRGSGYNRGGGSTPCAKLSALTGRNGSL